MRAQIKNRQPLKFIAAEAPAARPCKIDGWAWFGGWFGVVRRVEGLTDISVNKVALQISGDALPFYGGWNVESYRYRQ
jgi:hypothetical protein